MKVLLLAPPMGEFGGIQYLTRTWTRALGQILGDDCVRLLPVSGEPSTSARRDPRLSQAAKAQFLWRALREAERWEPDLCICTHLGLAPAARLIRGIFQCPYWVLAHGVEVWGHISPAKRAALRSADKIVVVSRFTLERLAERHEIRPGLMSCVPPVFDGDLLTVQPDVARLAGLEPRKKILTVGRLAAAERYKGHDVALQALPAVLEKVPDAAYLIAGDGDDRPRLEALAQDLGVHAHVSFLGHLDRPQIAAAYAACDVFALPSRLELDDRAPKGEGFGIVFLEAMAFGKPVVGPHIGAPADFIHDNENGLLVDPEDPVALAQALIQVLTQPELARRMGACGRRLVQEEYSFKVMVSRLQALLPAAK
jgi:phosphatidylinositol alpha-1,6-mannosyltransferase